MIDPRIYMANGDTMHFFNQECNTLIAEIEKEGRRVIDVQMQTTSFLGRVTGYTALFITDKK